MDQDPHVGQEIVGCRVTGVLGRGGMGVVYLAEQAHLQRQVALKLIADELANDEQFRDRFIGESRAAAAIDDPHVIPIYEAGEQDGLLYIVMRYVKGRDLGALIRNEGRMEPARAVTIVSHVGNALDAAHACGLVHRDVKPANVLVSEQATGPFAYLGDFGLAKRIGSLGGPTRTGQLVGTLGYVAPEQIQGQQVSALTDIYALGCMLYHALTGSLPFPRDTDAAMLFAHVHDPPPAVSVVRPELSAEFDEIVKRSMAKDPAQRFPSAGDVGRAAEAALGGRPIGSDERSVATGAAALPLLRRRERDLEGGPSGQPTRRQQIERDDERRPARRSAAGLGFIARPVRAHPVVTSVVVAGLAAGGIVAGVASGGGSGGHGASKKPTTSSPGSAAAARASAASAAGLTGRYTGPHYAASYPTGWRIAERDSSQSGYTETKFLSPDLSRSVVIDRKPGDTTDPFVKATQVEALVRRLPGYQRTTFRTATINGSAAFEWAFVERGFSAPFRTDIFLRIGNDGYAVLAKGSSPTENTNTALGVAASIAVTGH